DNVKNLAVIERSPLGTLDGLLHCLRYDILDWTWGGASTKKPASTPTHVARPPRQRQSSSASRATAVLSDAAAAAYLSDLLPEESHRRVVEPWSAVAKALPERAHDLGPNAADIRRLLDRVAAIGPVEMLRLIRASENVRPGLAEWAPAVHSASWAI